jgi:nucleotide-binding universal stress UspA family protein
MKILLAVDGSPNSTRAAKYIAQHWQPDAQITIVHVDAPLHKYIAEQLDEDSIRSFHTANGRAALRGAAGALAKAGHLFEECMLIGDPGTEIVQWAKKNRCDLIVMGSHGRGLLKSIFLGSVVVKVLSHSHIPSLVVH